MGTSGIWASLGCTVCGASVEQRGMGTTLGMSPLFHLAVDVPPVPLGLLGMSPLFHLVTLVTLVTFGLGFRV